ncbi:MAG: hypothetical protein AB7W59_06155 [Acidimicrobiia bacterium]
MGPDDVISFAASHRPALLDGDYVLTVSQTLGGGAVAHTFAPADPVSFTVAGPRFMLAPSDIHSFFPADGARGDLANTVPHVMLTRPTLPWERTAAQRSRSESDSAPPWLALLLFRKEELAGSTTDVVRASELFDGSPGVVHPRPQPGTGDDRTARVRVLDVPWSSLEPVLPDRSALPWLVHVRDVRTPGESAADIESSVVVSGRIVESGHDYVAHLVALEGWYPLNGWYPDPEGPAPGDVVRLVTLHSWRFTCDAGLTFAHELAAIRPGHLRLESRADSARPYLERGLVPLRHEFRNGDRAVSWYRGPLALSRRVAVGGLDVEVRLPARCADDLRIFETQSQMYDVTYAAAWELGRLLALQNPTIGLRLHQLSCERARYPRRLAVWTEHQHLPGAPPPPEVPVLDDVVTSWFATHLLELRAVPYRYLLPHDDLVPPEHIQRFIVDPSWLACLVDGALSVGRASSEYLRDEIGAAATVLDEGALPPPADLSAPQQQLEGFILRSQILVDYPGVMLDVTRADGSPCIEARVEHLAPGMLLALYRSPIHSVSLHLHPQVLHFGVEDPGSASGGFLTFPAVEDDRDVPSGEFALGLLAPLHRAVFEEA